jgi:uncharacterized low-complexity protein
MKKLLQLGLILAGTTAFTLTAVNAKCAEGKETSKEMKCQAGKCGGAMKEKVKGMKCQDGKCGADKMKEKAKENTKEKEGKEEC